MTEEQIYVKMKKTFNKMMMTSPQVPLNLAFYQDLLKNVTNKFEEEFSNEELHLIEDVAARIGNEFVWHTDGVEKDSSDGGYYQNINSPKKLYGKALYKVLRIENNPQEQEMADKLYGTGEDI